MTRDGVTLDEWVDRQVAAERDEPDVVFARWKAARRARRSTRYAPPIPMRGTRGPTRPSSPARSPRRDSRSTGRTRSTSRCRFAIPLPDTDRLRHIAWLGHSTLPYGFAFNGQDAHDVYAELTAPDGVEVWRFGPSDADSTITGAAGAFCRVGAQRLTPEESGLVATGPHAAAALRVLRNYAG